MPETTVVAIITTVEGGTTKILLTRRNIEPFKNQWCLPGGHIDQYEFVREAVVREIKEETGLDFDARFFDFFDEIIPEQDIHAVVMVFEGPGSGTLDIPEDEVTDIKWFSIDEARFLPLAFTHNEILDMYATRNRSISDDLRSEILAEYSALRDEILKRLEMRQQVLTFTLVVAGTLLGVGVQENVTPLVLLIYPVLASFLALVWVQSDVRVGEIAEFIEKNIEPQLEGVRWETHIHEKYKGFSPRFRVAEVSALGVFVIAGILALLLALPRLSFSVGEIAFLIFDVAVLVIIFISLRRRSAMLVPSRETEQGD